MNSQNVSIDVCVLTYQRPDLLSQLLTSLEKQEFEPTLDFRIVVIDNDAIGSAREIVENFSTRSRFAIQYDIEPVQNIALARNRALDCSSTDFVAFIDDDEIADPHWIQNLYDACEKFNAGVVFGPVLPTFPPAAPQWIIKGGFFDRKRYRSGTKRDEGGTGNTLLKRSALTAISFRFDPSFGLTGGEDSEFFYRAFAAQIKMVWCDEAIAYEQVSFERMTVRWLASRALRTGQTLALVRNTTFSLPVRIYYFLRRLLLLPCYSFVFVLCLPFGRIRWVKFLQQAIRCLGYISTVTNYRYREYN